MAKTKTNDVLPMNDKMKTVREALEPFAHFAEKWIAMPAGRLPDDAAIYSIHGTTEYAAEITLGDCKRAIAALAAIDSMEAEEPVAWMVETRIGNELVTTLAVTEYAVKQIAIERYRNGSNVHHAEPIPLYAHPKAHGEVELTEDEFELQNLMNRCSREHAAKDGADELSRETMAVFVTWLRDHGHLAPFAPLVELAEEDLAEIAHQQWRKGLRELSLTLSGAKLMEDGAMNALRHLTSKYRLIPR